MSLPSGVKRPLGATPDRSPGSVRRSSHVDMVWLPAEGVVAGPGTVLVLRAGARDVATGWDGRGRVVAEAALTAELGPGNRIERLETVPAVAGVDDLVGRVAGQGFRGAARRVVAEHSEEPLGLLLDDLPVAALISGYGPLRSGALTSSLEPGGERLGYMRDLCSGWRSEGVMMASIERGEGVPIPDLAPAPDLSRPDDPLASEAMSPLPGGSLRRRRRIDVLAGEPVRIEAMFRDTYAGPGGQEGVLHEYAVGVTVDDGRVADIEAEPRVLPWPECPAAADHVRRLVGAAVGNLAADVPATLSGIASCTHLNDLLRSLSSVPRLTRLRP